MHYYCFPDCKLNQISGKRFLRLMLAAPLLTTTPPAHVSLSRETIRLILPSTEIAGMFPAVSIYLPHLQEERKHSHVAVRLNSSRPSIRKPTTCCFSSRCRMNAIRSHTNKWSGICRCKTYLHVRAFQSVH
jgi:hypothetical protein